MPSNHTRSWLLIGAPLAFAALLMLHPMGGGDFYTTVSENVTPWLAVHYGAAVMFPLMGYVVWLMVRDLPGRAATIARIAVPIYAVFYGVFEALVGIATGIAAQQGNGMSGAERGGVGRPTLVLLGLGTFMAIHVIGPVALLCLSGAAFLVERHRAAPVAAIDGLHVAPSPGLAA